MDNRRQPTATDEDRLGLWLRRERERRGWTQAQVAERLAKEGITLHPSAIAKMEDRDARRPRAVRLDEAAALARVFDKSLDEVLAPSKNSIFELQANAQRWLLTSTDLRFATESFLESFERIAHEERAEDIASIPGISATRSMIANVLSQMQQFGESPDNPFFPYDKDRVASEVGDTLRSLEAEGSIRGFDIDTLHRHGLYHVYDKLYGAVSELLPTYPECKDTTGQLRPTIPKKPKLSRHSEECARCRWTILIARLVRSKVDSMRASAWARMTKEERQAEAQEMTAASRRQSKYRQRMSR